MAAIALAGSSQPIAVLDDDPARWGERVGGVAVVGGIDAVADFVDADLLICVGSGSVRRSIAHRLSDQGVEPERYASVVHPSASLSPGCEVGTGSIVLGGVVGTADVLIGAHVVLMPTVVLTHDCVIEDFATLCAGVTLGGGVRIGEAAYLGMNSSIRQDLVLGAESVLGMGAALLKDLPAGQVWAGCPAHLISAPRAGNSAASQRPEVTS